ncbi:protein S100-G [Paroedura picta]|uniref:protein S100-G n=1 Tax=Paroedura picta TaxID=143630 RepID=UPI00101518F6
MANLNGDELLKLFTQYAVKEGSTHLLSTTGLNNLLQNHFSNLVGSFSLGDMAKYVQVDKEGKISFDAFKALMSKISGFSALSGLTNLVS